MADHALRARLCTRALLPLVSSLAEADDAARAIALGPETLAVVVGGEARAWLAIGGGRAVVLPAAPRGEVARLDLGSERALADFFAGRPSAAPRALGSALRSPRAVSRVLRLLARLRVLEPRDEVPAEERVLYTRLVLRFLARGVAELARPGGDPDAVRLAARSPDRVYQWRVAETGEAAWVRLREGRVGSGVGAHPERSPFVETVFPTTDAACRVLAGASSRMESVARGDVETVGSPEYGRALARLSQRLDVLVRGAA